MFPNVSQDQLDAVLRGGLSIEEAMNPALLNAAKKNKQWAENAAAPDFEDDAPKVKPQGRSFGRQGFATGAVPMMNHGASGAYHAAVGAQQQGQALGNMISQTMGAYQDEHDSRVAQMREARRMQHEREMKQMELDALLARIQAARG